jgi:diguanylate cyclase (GGDEF)-like protein/PAS domain S-box-containing protein
VLLALIDQLPGLVWYAGTDGACRFVNRAWLEFNGRSLAETLNDGWLDSILHADRHQVAAAVSRAAEHRESFRIEYRLLRAAGDYGWIVHQAGPYYDQEGRFSGLLGSCHDISAQKQAEVAAETRERQLRLIAEHVPTQIAYFDSETQQCKFANRQYARHNGWESEASILGKTFTEIIGAEASEMIKPYVERARKKESVTYERPFRMPGGEQRAVEVSLVPHLDRFDEMIGTCVLMHDVTRHREAERNMRDSESLLRRFMDSINEGILMHQDGRVIECNEPIGRLVGVLPNDLIGRPVLDLVAPEHKTRVRDNIRLDFEGRYEASLVHRDGRRVPTEIISRMTEYRGRVVRMAVLRDITERKQAEARIQYMAHHDALTGLPNRAWLVERLETLLERADQSDVEGAVMFIDLDHFKGVNDSLGHYYGDQLLQKLAERVERCVRRSDIVARLGGDEFLVVLSPIETSDQAGNMAERIMQALSEPMDMESHKVATGCSIGIALYPRDGSSADDLIKNADTAMYLAKEQGRGNYQFFTQSLSDIAFETFATESRLREAIKHQQFVLHYQPQVQVTDGRLVGIEALVRWNDPERGLVPPDQFVPIAEQRGLIQAIGLWVLRAACQQNKQWQDAQLPCVPIAVNLSPLQFKQPNFVADVARVLQETGLEPAYLEIELTESLLVDDAVLMTRTLHELKDLGVKLTIDDFGTGYSSLSYLKYYPIDKLKIDRSFIQNVPRDQDNVAITTAIVNMAKSLKMMVLAEGVENPAQLQFLSTLNCEQVQGFMIARPLAASDLQEWLSQWGSGSGEAAYRPAHPWHIQPVAVVLPSKQREPAIANAANLPEAFSTRAPARPKKPA